MGQSQFIDRFSRINPVLYPVGSGNTGQDKINNGVEEKRFDTFLVLLFAALCLRVVGPIIRVDPLHDLVDNVDVDNSSSKHKQHQPQVIADDPQDVFIMGVSLYPTPDTSMPIMVSNERYYTENNC